MPNKKLKFIGSSKKSQFEDLLPLLVTIIFLFGFWLFFAFMNINATIEASEKLKLNTLGEDSSQLLIDFLNTPFPVKDIQDSSIADAITNYFLTENKTLLSQIDAKADEYFSKSSLETDSSSWSLEIYQGKKDIKFESKKIGTKGVLSKKLVSEIKMPSYSNNLIEIKLFFIGHKFIT